MAKTIEALFDGKILVPDEPLGLEPNTRVRIVVEEVLSAHEEPMSFLDTALSLNLDGPPDWSANLDSYLYGSLHVDQENGSDETNDVK